jgi:hypothetical protein
MAALGQKKTLAVQQPMSPNSGHAGQKRTKHIRQKIKPVTRKNQGLLQDCRQSSGYGKRTASIDATNWPVRQCPRITDSRKGTLADTPSAPLTGLPKIQGSCMRNLDLPKLLPTAVVVAFTLMIWFVIPVPAGVSLNAWHLFALFVGTIVGIISNAMPLGAISIVAIALVAVTGVTNPGKPAAAVMDALSGFANPLIWLIVIAVMVAMAVLKTGLGRRIGYYFVMLLGKRTLGVAYGLVLSELVIAPVTPSNTARGGCIIHPIMRSIAASYGSSPELGTTKTIGRYLALVNYNVNPITSAMFITATAPNPLLVALIAQATGSSIHITWGQWALAALLPCLCMLLVMPLVLYFIRQKSNKLPAPGNWRGPSWLNSVRCERRKKSRSGFSP